MKAISAAFQNQLEQTGLRPVDIALADWGLRHGGGTAGALGLALCNQAVGAGDTCLRLDQGAEFTARSLVTAEALREGLADNPIVTTPDQAAVRPLVLDGERLYLQRYWDYEVRLASRLKRRRDSPPAAVDAAALTASGLFDGPDADGTPDWQAVAAFVAQRHRLAVISGGPGTGKTYTVVRLMVQRIREAIAMGNRPPAIQLAAPTGKAAARLMDSVQDGLEALALDDEVRNALPETATTLHRLLRLRPDSTRPGHNRDNPVPADMVVVDEASMVDLPLMAKLAEALPEIAQLILLGDRYQLASVESGAVLADICQAAGVNAFSDEQCGLAAPLIGDPTGEVGPISALGDHVVTLRTSHRFRADRPIGRLATAINNGDAEAVQAILNHGEDEVTFYPRTDTATVANVVDQLARHYARMHEAPDVVSALDMLAERRALTVTRVGPHGSIALNERLTRTLAARYGFDPTTRWYHARPIMIAHNEPRAGLYNGDVGLLWRDSGGLRAWFRTEQGLEAFDPSLLPEHETVYAMTVHKAQGSEFETVYLLFPDTQTPILTRELLYTAVTRARGGLIVAGDHAIIAAGIANRMRRESGLAERLAD